MSNAAQPIRLLVADDDRDVLQAASLALMSVSEVNEAHDSEEALRLLEKAPFDCMLLDMNFMPTARSGAEGLSLLREIRRRDPTVGIILMTAFGGVVLAVEGLKAGADDFLLKPWRNEQLLSAVQMAASLARTRRSGSTLDDFEKAAVAAALRMHKGNIAHAAATLGISRPALYRRIAKHGL